MLELNLDIPREFRKSLNILRDYIVGLLGILITPEDAEASKLNVYSLWAFADAGGTAVEDLAEIPGNNR